MFELDNGENYICENCGADIELSHEDEGYVCGTCKHEEIFLNAGRCCGDDKEI